MSFTETNVAPTDRGIRVLAFDSGGIRGLSSLVLLRELMLRVAVAEYASDPVRPCDYFDLIVGAGTGGLSALFVGRMRMTVDEAIAAYLLVGKKGFKRSAVPLFQRLRGKEALLDGDSLTRVIGDIVHEYVGNRDAPMQGPPRNIGTGGRSCGTAVLATSSANASDPPHVFRSYSTINWDPASTHAIHEVARATTATAGLFPSISLGFPSYKFIEAGVAGYSNPALEALSEVERIWPGANISCLVSLGTGLQGIVKVGGTWESVLKVSRRLIEDCEKVHEQLLRRCRGAALPYYRFNVTTGLDAAGIPEWDQETNGVIAAITAGYTRKGDVEGLLKSCVSLLVGKAPEANIEARPSLQLLKTIRDDALAEKVYAWLKAPDSSQNYNDAFKKHQGATGSWFIDGETFSAWKKSRRFLCVYGNPGWGKTILCSSIISNVVDICKENGSTACAYFFFDGRDAQSSLQRHDGFIRSLIQQFIDQCGGIPSTLAKLYGRGHQQPSTNALEDVLQHILAGFADSYIIIDGVDECAERRELLTWISKIASSKIENLHLLATSRPEEDIKASLRSLVSITMEEGPINHDIEAYIDVKIQEDRLGAWPNNVRLHIKETLLKRVQGMFRWLVMQLEELQNCLDLAELDDQLKRLPKDLDETYSRVLERIPEQRRTKAKIFLQWTAFSARPPSLQELCEAGAFELDSEGVPNYNPLRKPQARDVLVACASLIIESNGYVKLSHFSVKEYLTSERISSGLIFFRISERLAHSYMSQTCLAYLLRFDSLEALSDDTLPDFPLATYAAEKWVFHVRLAGNEDSAVVKNLMMTLFESGVLLTNWNRLYNPYFPRFSSTKLFKVRTVPNPLHYASRLGFSQVVRGLLEKVPSPDSMHGWNINSTWGNRDRGTAIEVACIEGHAGVVKTLLDLGMDVNAREGKALAHASSEGHIDIIQTLLDQGADINAGYGGALVSASESGNVEVVKMLLDLDADVNAGGGKALACASWRGRIEVVQVLLDRGADINAGDGNALVYASQSGNHIEIVKILLDRGADANAGHGEALSNVSKLGNIGIIKMFLDRGADINAGGGKALAGASSRGHIKVVKTPLDWGADVNAGDGRALACAAEWANIEVIETLLDCGADINARNGMALAYASWRGRIEVAKMLLDRGADVNAGDGRALGYASRRGRIEMVSMLLARGADVNAGDGRALAYASRKSRIKVVEMLLERGVDINAGDGRALAYASKKGHHVIERLLLEHGAKASSGVQMSRI